jgi:hypothetical protein
MLQGECQMPHPPFEPFTAGLQREIRPSISDEPCRRRLDLERTKLAGKTDRETIALTFDIRHDEGEFDRNAMALCCGRDHLAGVGRCR